MLSLQDTIVFFSKFLKYNVDMPKALKKLPKIDQNRVSTIIKEFQRLYPTTGSELNFKNPFELVVAVSLSAQCTDKKVNEVSPLLFAKFPDFKSLAAARVSSIETIIRPINYYKTKAKNIKAMAEKVVEEFNGKLPSDHEILMTLPGVGRKTANVVLSELKIQPSIPVDTHVFRVSKRLGFAHDSNPHKVEMELESVFDSSLWYNVHHWLIYHGRRVCKAQRPLCGECTLSKLCPSNES